MGAATRAVMRRVAIVGAVLALTAGFYLLLIDTVSPPELYAGLGLAVLVLIGFELAHQQGFIEATFDPRWLLRGPSVLARVPGHVAVVCWAALAQLFSREPARGRFRAVPFKAGD